jgi:hypothetical protein
MHACTIADSVKLPENHTMNISHPRRTKHQGLELGFPQSPPQHTCPPSSNFSLAHGVDQYDAVSIEHIDLEPQPFAQGYL